MQRRCARVRASSCGNKTLNRGVFERSSVSSVKLQVPQEAPTMLQAPVRSASPHVIVVGNEKGGSGKTTIAMHIAVALLKAGQRVATIDLDSRQKSLTHYVENRDAWARRIGV